MGGGGLAGVGEFVLQRIQIYKTDFFFGGGGGGGGGGGEKGWGEWGGGTELMNLF